jgi:hypothetical protein
MRSCAVDRSDCRSCSLLCSKSGNCVYPIVRMLNRASMDMAREKGWV